MIMGDRLAGKVCLVTGSARGIGRAIAEVFASEGATVIVNGTHNGSADEWISKSEYSGSFDARYFDITDHDAVKNNLLSIKKQHGHIDVLVNNAGVEYNELIGMIQPEHVDHMFKVNVYAVIDLIQLTARMMTVNEKGGSIINISSLTASRGNAGQLAYSATKGAIESITISAAKELAAKKIRVNAVAPGLTRTDMMEQADDEKLKSRIDNIGMGRLAQPVDIARACVFFAADESAYVSGQILAVDGCTVI